MKSIFVFITLLLTSACSSEIITQKETNECLNPISIEFSDRIEHVYIKGLFNNKSIVNGGEWSTAFREVGAGDFVGGWHGDHILTSQTKTENKIKQTLELKSYFDDSTIATQKREYTFYCDAISVKQSFKFKKDVVFDSVYFAMLPILRENLTHSAERFDTGLFEDVSTTNFEIQKTTDSKVRIWGDEISATVEVKKSSIEYFAYIINSNHYNKVYFGDNTKKTKAQTGEEWTFETVYNFEKL